MLKHIVIVSLSVMLQVTALCQQCVVQGHVHDERAFP